MSPAFFHPTRRGGRPRWAAWCLLAVPALFGACTEEVVYQRPPPPRTVVVERQTVVYARPAPPPPPLIVEYRPVAPAYRVAWVPGHWRWTGYRYVWVRGHYRPV